MAIIDYPNAPKQLSMQDFRSYSDNKGGLAKNCRFAAVIQPVGNLLREVARDFTRDLTYLCEATEFPGRGMLNLDLRYYGPNLKLPIQSQYEDISMIFLCRTDSYERKFFDDWMLMMNPINTFDFNYRDDYRSRIDIYQFAEYAIDKEPKAVYAFTLNDAYPLLINPQPVAWGDDQFQKLSISFTYTFWERYGLDPTQGPVYDLVNGRNNIRSDAPRNGE